jgi:hypothetical protein
VDEAGGGVAVPGEDGEADADRDVDRVALGCRGDGTVVKFTVDK